MLETAGHQVCETNCDEEAVAQFGKRPIDVLFDLIMSVRNDMEHIQDLRGRLPNRKIVVMSGLPRK